MGESAVSLVIRLAGPLQSWGVQSQFNVRRTGSEPTKSGIVGLLAAAEGRRRSDPIEDLLALSMGVRTDYAGSLLRDYHTVSDLFGRPLLSASITGRGAQKRTQPQKRTHVTERFYLEDAVFVVAVTGPESLLIELSEALRHPCFPLFLGRRSCVPTQPLVLEPDQSDGMPVRSPLWPGTALSVLGQVPRQVAAGQEQVPGRNKVGPVRLAVVVDDVDGDDLRTDVASSFEPRSRSFGIRRVRSASVLIGEIVTEDATGSHDPFVLLEQ